MRKAGYERTLVQCRDKKLKGDYRKIKDGHKEMGNNRKRSKFYKKMNEVMSAKHSVTPPLILDTSVENSSVVESCNFEPSEDDVEEIPETDLEDKSVASEKETVKGDKVTVAEEKGSVEEDIKPQLGSKRKKSVKIDKMEKVIDKMYEKISSQQAESDRVYADIEEKRIKLEHDLLMMLRDIQREQSERAERQRREEREFQLQMFSMLCGHRQSSAPVFGGQHYYPSPGTYGAVGNDSGNSNNSASVYRGDDY